MNDIKYCCLVWIALFSCLCEMLPLTLNHNHKIALYLWAIMFFIRSSIKDFKFLRDQLYSQDLVVEKQMYVLG